MLIRILSFCFLMIICFPAMAEGEGSSEIECGEAVSIRSIEYCAQAEFDDAEALRKELENQLLESAAQIDAGYQASSSSVYKELAVNADSTQRSKTSFEKYREDECARVYSGYGLGAERDIGLLVCQTRLTNQRLEILKYALNL